MFNKDYDVVEEGRSQIKVFAAIVITAGNNQAKLSFNFVCGYSRSLQLLCIVSSD